MKVESQPNAYIHQQNSRIQNQSNPPPYGVATQQQQMGGGPPQQFPGGSQMMNPNQGMQNPQFMNNQGQMPPQHQVMGGQRKIEIF